MLQVQLPDGSVKEYPENYTAIDVAKTIGERLANATLAAEVNGTVVDAMRPLEQVSNLPAGSPIPLKLITNKDPRALGVMRHSAAHIMARAVMRLYPGVGLAFGPTTGHGFYYDFDLDTKISEDDFPRIEEEMKKIIADAEPFERFSDAGRGDQVLRRPESETEGGAHPDWSRRSRQPQLLSAR